MFSQMVHVFGSLRLVTDLLHGLLCLLLRVGRHGLPRRPLSFVRQFWLVCVSLRSGLRCTLLLTYFIGEHVLEQKFAFGLTVWVWLIR